MSASESQSCPACQKPSMSDWARYALLPSEDIPQAGSRTEVVVSPGRCLRLSVRICGACGHVELRSAT